MAVRRRCRARRPGSRRRRRRRGSCDGFRSAARRSRPARNPRSPPDRGTRCRRRSPEAARHRRPAPAVPRVGARAADGRAAPGRPSTLRRRRRPDGAGGCWGGAGPDCRPTRAAGRSPAAGAASRVAARPPPRRPAIQPRGSPPSRSAPRRRWTRRGGRRRARHGRCRQSRRSCRCPGRRSRPSGGRPERRRWRRPARRSRCARRLPAAGPRAVLAARGPTVGWRGIRRPAARAADLARGTGTRRRR